MKRFMYMLCALGLAMGVAAQSTEQSGVVAKMELANGKIIPVYLQSLQDGKLVFQIYKRPQNIPLPDIAKVANFEFIGKFDLDGYTQLFNAGDYQGLIDRLSTDLKPSLEDYWQYMRVDNNLQDLFSMLLDAYRGVGDSTSAEKYASIFMDSENPGIRAKGQSSVILATLGAGRIEEAEKLIEDVDSEAGKLYLKACVAKAKKELKEAFALVDEIIVNYGNDLAWMPQAELLDVNLYMDAGLTNSAINTARQVKNIYAGTRIAADAEKLQTAIEEAKAKAEAEAKARQEAEEQARAEVRARAKARAGVMDDGTDGEAVQENDSPDTSTDDGEADENDG